MKKFLAALMVLVVCVSGVSAFAAGKLDVVTENFHVISSYWTEAYTYAKVENIGDKPITVEAGIFEVYDESGDVITSEDYLNAYAKYLQPGEYTYAKMYESIDEDGVVPSDYMLTITGKSENEYVSVRIPCEPELALDMEDNWGYKSDYVCATVTNNTEEPLYSIEVVMALLDAEGNILYIADDALYSERALMPGSSMFFRKEITSSFRDYYESNGITLDSVDAIAYVNKRVD